MRLNLFIFFSLCLILTFSSCRKEPSSSIQTNPNIVNGCEITQTQVVETNLNTHQVRTSITDYHYDSLARLLAIGDGQGNDTSHFHYHGGDCDDDNHDSWHNSPDGYALSASNPEGSYQYSYDGSGHIQLEIYVDSARMGNDNSYAKSYYWDNNGNMSYAVLQFHSQPTPVMISYAYFSDKTNQVLVPNSLQLGKPSKNLLQSEVATSSGMVISSNVYSYVFDGSGKVTQYTDLYGHEQIVCTLVYSCH